MNINIEMMNYNNDIAKEDKEISFILSNCTTSCEVKPLFNPTYTDKEKEIIEFLEELSKKELLRNNKNIYYNSKLPITFYSIMNELESYLNINNIKGVDILTEKIEYKVIRIKDKIYKFKVPN